MSIHRLLITGAAGALGTVARDALAGSYPVIRVSDRMAMGAARPGEEVMLCELADRAAVAKLLEGVDAVIHFGGQPNDDAPLDTILNANIHGAVNLWEAAREAGTKRILFASSNHAIGFHRRSNKIDHLTQKRPDGHYGLTKAFGEDLARLYADKHGIKAFCMRIGSCFPEPVDARMLTTFLSYADLVRLLKVGLTADYHFEVVYGVSNNTKSFWDNRNAERLGYHPQDSAAPWTAALSDKIFANPVAETFQGGTYCAAGFTGSIENID
jgi:uronate dehydrogenase